MPAEISEEERSAAAAEGHALPDGSYPMRNCQEVADARQAYGRAPEDHRAELARLINRRNGELHCGQPDFRPARQP